MKYSCQNKNDHTGIKRDFLFSINMSKWRPLLSTINLSNPLRYQNELNDDYVALDMNETYFTAVKVWLSKIDCCVANAICSTIKCLVTMNHELCSNISSSVGSAQKLLLPSMTAVLAQERAAPSAEVLDLNERQIHLVMDMFINNIHICV